MSKSIPDFIYESLRRAVIDSYVHGPFDNKLKQMDISLVILNEKYDHDYFKTIALDKLQEARKQLLTDVQEEVDKLVGTFAGFDMTN